MSTAEMTTAEILEQFGDDETVAVYISKSTNLVLCRQPKDEEINSLRQIVATQKSVKYSFAPTGTLVVRVGQDMLADGPGGELRDAIAWLDSHVNLNTTFVREGHEPDRALPTEKDFLAGVNRALVARDVVALQTVLAEEQGTHNRKVLVDSAVSALSALRDAGVDVDEARPADRGEMVAMALGLGLEVTAETTDEQLRAALEVATAPDPK